MGHREVTLLINSQAKRHYGVVARRNLIAAGANPRSIDSRIRGRFLKTLYAGVYSLGHDVLTMEGRWMAAVLAGGPKAVLSHRAAAGLLGLLPPVRRVEVIRSSSPDKHRPPPDHASRSIHPGLIIHRTRSISPREVTKFKGIPVTSAVRTMINLAEKESPGTLRTAIRNGIRLKRFTAAELSRALEQTRGRKGIRTLRMVLEAWNPSELRTRSDLEIGFLDLCRNHGLPAPYVNDKRNDHEVDFQWDGSNLIVETDGGSFHEDHLSRGKDYRRDLDLAASGMRICRLDEKMVFEEAAETAELIRRLLAADLGKASADNQANSPQAVAVNDRGPP